MPKVSAVVSPKDHARLCRIADRNASTIGIVVLSAIRRFIAGYPIEPVKLKRDGRRKKRVE